VTSTFFDVGGCLVVVGLLLDVLRSLGAEVDRQEEEDAFGHPSEVSEPQEEPLPVSVAGTSPNGRGDA